MDPSYWVGGISGSTPHRASNTIKYSNSVGPLSLQADLRLNGGGDETGTEGLAGDGGGIGLRVAVTDNVTLGFAYDTEDRSDVVTKAVSGTAYTFTGDDVSFFDLDHEDMIPENATEGNETWDSGEAIAGQIRIDTEADTEGYQGDVYCLSDAQVLEKATKIGINNVIDNATAVSLPAVADLDTAMNGVQSACEFSAASTGPETDRIGISAHVSMGQFWGKLGWTSKEVDDEETDYTQLWLGTSFTDSTSAMIGYGKSETDGNTAEPNALTLGLYHNMGGGLRLWYEGISADPDGGLNDDGTMMHKSTNHYVGIRYDF
ncbi:MAG: hypothetical protein F4Z15_12100 [Gammaproteobacteria bacterium]|nr:hypothetical protein [Gammaproteobacteria bacterium]